MSLQRRPGRDPTTAPRSRDENKEVIIQRPQRVIEEILIWTPQSGLIHFDLSAGQPVAKSFHTTISEDRTDQEALEAHRLVALQPKAGLNDPLVKMLRV